MRCLRLGRGQCAGWNGGLAICALLLMVLGLVPARAQENPLGDVKTPAPAPTEPKDTRTLITGTDVGKKAMSSPGS